MPNTDLPDEIKEPAADAPQEEQKLDRRTAIAQARALYPDLMVRIVVPTIPLAHQWEMALLHQSGPDEWRPGFFGGGKRDDPDRHVIIYIINSARDSLAGHIRRDLALQRHVLLICDECHHYTSKENRKIFGFLEGAHASALREKELYLCLGLSATPFGTSNDEVLFRSLGREIYQYGFDSAVNEGIISPFTVCEVSSSFYADELAEYGELTFRIGKALIALLRAHPQLKKLRERKEKSLNVEDIYNISVYVDNVQLDRKLLSFDGTVLKVSNALGPNHIYRLVLSKTKPRHVDSSFADTQGDDPYMPLPRQVYRHPFFEILDCIIVPTRNLTPGDNIHAHDNKPGKPPAPKP